jgi:hypothetical protein
MNRAPDIFLDDSLTSTMMPPRTPAPMPTQEIAVWTPKLALTALWRAVVDVEPAAQRIPIEVRKS